MGRPDARMSKSALVCFVKAATTSEKHSLKSLESRLDNEKITVFLKAFESQLDNRMIAFTEEGFGIITSIIDNCMVHGKRWIIPSIKQATLQFTNSVGTGKKKDTIT